MIKSQLFLAMMVALITSLALFALAGCSCASPQSDTSATSTDVSQISVTITLNSEAADNSVSGNESIMVPDGSSVLDVMEASSYDVTVVDSQYGAYIDANNGLKTGDFGGMSGWIYTFNEETVSVSAGECILMDGDTIDWTNVTKMS